MLEAYMREKGLVIEGPGVPVRPPEPISRTASAPKTMEDALTKEVANENAQAFAFMRAQVAGVKHG